jgi:hypothetical protein
MVAVPAYVVTAEDRAWFEQCHRAWDFGARGRQHLEARDPDARAADPTAALRGALAVHYYPGMWSWSRAIVEPLVTAAYEQADGPPIGRPALEAFQRWSMDADRFTPIRVEADVFVPVPDPERPGHALVASDGLPVRYEDRVPLVLLHDGDDRCWLGFHHVVDGWADPDRFVLDERALLACWAWEQLELATPVHGVLHTELRLDPPDVRRTTVRFGPARKEAAAARLGRSVRRMLADGLDVVPNPSWAHCARCPFRAPCVALEQGEDVTELLATGYRPRPADVVEEGRLGGGTWSMGRGAAPPRFRRDV